MLREALGTHPRLDYGLDGDLYLSPTSTLFAYERKLAESPDAAEPVGHRDGPLRRRPHQHPAWSVRVPNEVLGRFAFHALCTYDTRRRRRSRPPGSRTVHQHRSERVDSPDYLDPADFLSDPRAAAPRPPEWSRRHLTLHSVEDLARPAPRPVSAPRRAPWPERRSTASSSP